MNNLYAGLKGAIAFLALTAIGCTQPAETDWLNLDRAETSFPASGNNTLTINVDASSANWTATADKDWITLSEQTANSIVITVAENTNIERSGAVTFTLGGTKEMLTIYQSKRAGLPSHFRKFDFYESAAISPSGKYITALGGGTDNGKMVFNVYLVEVATDKTTHVGTYPSETTLSAPNCVTDDGSMMFFAKAWTNTMMFEPDGNSLVLSYADLGLGTPRIKCVSVDGRIWGGYLDGTDEGGVPYIFRDGEPYKRLPIPDTNFRGAPKKHGVLLRGGSADGSMFYGSSWDGFDCGMCYWDKDLNFHWVGGDRHKTKAYETTDSQGNPMTVHVVEWGVQCRDELFKMSPNGQYIGGNMYEEYFDPEQKAALGTATGACVYDTVNDKLYEMPSGTTVTNVTNSGLAVVANSGGAGFTDSYIYDLKTETVLGDSVEWVRENFGIDIGGTGCFVTHIMGENDDVVFGYYMPQSTGLVVYNAWYAAKNK